ncbi:hypothetical protein [Eubacterium oxidoreducens]|uniref:Uncharacterized protein n=1 Tax=Eubacterium oxidoreducens TaxID=1732 RepID=A0A1G6BCW1_EUBOX|nr:hypothetical protein [Eubacterium oxidoreducens]SDB18492.1 hypothetical protein SAMN02910417_01389 [Eubacterium oxidoreducens]
MRGIVIGVSLVLAGIFLVLTVLSIHGRAIRMVNEQATLESTVESALDETLEQNLFTQKSQEEFVIEFLQHALIRLNPNAQIQVDIAAADLEKGILAVKVTEEYDSIGQKVHTLTYETTALLEREGPKHYCSVIFEDEDGNVVRKYKLTKGEKMILPTKAPKRADKKFVHWKSMSGHIAVAGEVVEQDVIYRAQYQ